MTGGGPQTRSSKAGEHLQLLRSLAAELERAVQAIASNHLHQLEESIARQQELSARLSQLASELKCRPSAADLSAVDSIPPDLMQAIRSAAAELQGLNLRYAHLVQLSSRSVGLMASLFSSFKGQIKEVPGPRLKLQTWSCQV